MTSISTYVAFIGVLVEDPGITNVRKNMVLEDNKNGGKIVQGRKILLHKNDFGKTLKTTTTLTKSRNVKMFELNENRKKSLKIGTTRVSIKFDA